jgi:hypothetical protein
MVLGLGMGLPKADYNPDLISSDTTNDLELHNKYEDNLAALEANKND